MAGSSEAVVSARVPGSVIDLSGQGLQKLGPMFPCPVDTLTLILDKNQIIKLEHLEKCKNLMQLSVANNRLVRMMGVAKLTQLRVLNLPHNSIGYVEGLRELVYLEWLNLAGNNLKTIDQISSCSLLSHLDLSDNNLSQIGDLSKLVNLRTLLLHGNTITSLRAASACLPHSLTILSLAENEIRDLNEISFLACLRDLEQLSIMNNPCVMATPSIPGFDYRPYVVSWCLSLKVLDGYVVSQKESLKAEWLYSQGKGRYYRPGQHVPLVQYLASVCPLTSTVGLKTAEDAKLEKILNKQRFHQRQLLRQGQEEENSSPSIPNRGLTPSEFQNLSPGQQSSLENEFGIQLDSWLASSSSEDRSHTMRNFISHSNQTIRSHHSELYLEDIQTDEDKLNCSLLSSESTFMPVAPGLSPVSPNVGRWISGNNLEQQVNSTVLEYVKTADEGKLEKAEMGMHIITENAYNTSKTEWKPKDELFPQPNPANSCNNFTPSISKFPACSAITIGHTLNDGKTAAEPNCQNESCSGISRSTDEVSYLLLQRNKAATKLQACWRGFYARNYNPKAKNVRYEIRLSRMQEHILLLSSEISKLRKERNEERIQRLVQEKAIKVLWSQVRTLQQWQSSINQHMSSNWQSNVVVDSSLCPSHLSPHTSNCVSEVANDIASCSEINQDNLSSDFPDSGFCSNLVDPAYLNDSICSGKISTEESENFGQPEEITKPHNTENPDGPSNVKDDQEDCEKLINAKPAFEQDNSLIQTFLESDNQLADVEETNSCDLKRESIPHPTDLPENLDSFLNIDFSEELHKTSSTFQNGIIHMPEISQLQEEDQ